MLSPLRLYSKLAMSITGFALVIAIGFVSLVVWSSDRYHQEVTQRLHENLAQYVLEHLPGPLFIESPSEDLINKKVLKATAINTMEINPAVEVYLLDGEGKVLAHALPESSIKVNDIDVSAIHRFLDPTTEGPVRGQNPRQLSQQTIFSAAPVSFNGDMKGYLYVVLASYEAHSLAEQLSGSHVARLTLGAVAALVLFMGVSAFFAFKRITKPLHELSASVKSYRQTKLGQVENESVVLDEVGELRQAFNLMQQRIQEQFDQLSETDRMRRELVSNVSHDLRTPLASMQGYLETLLIKEKDLTAEKQRHYIQIAHRHSHHLNTLISQLFELSKLDAGKVEPEYEAFSLTELAYDVKQDYELMAEDKGISLYIDAPEDNALVFADISLIQRVLQNLIDNAMKHTPQDGRIGIVLAVLDNQVKLSVHDSGSGIRQEDLPYVFERFYQSGSEKTNHRKAGAGLGLSIVQKILALHGSLVTVESVLHEGTSFQFELPLAA